MRRAWLVALAACQATTEGLPEDCLPDRPAPGQVVVAQVRCSDMTLPGGEGGIGDIWFANHEIRGIFRYPEASLSLIGIDGGSVIDVARWDGNNEWLHEAAPLVDGGGLQVDTWTILPNGLQLEGTIASINTRPSESEGQRAVVKWLIPPDRPEIIVEGADALWLHPEGGNDVLTGHLWSGASEALVHDGKSYEDLGGAVIVDGVNTLRLDTPASALSWLAQGDAQPVSGRASGATRIALSVDGMVLGRLPVEGGLFEAEIPAAVTGLRAIGGGRPASSVAPPGQNVTLLLGDAGTVEVQPAWDARPRPLRMSWVASDGRSGANIVDSGGSSASIGAGSYTLTFTAGPSYGTQTLDIDIPAGSTFEVGVRLPVRFDPGNTVLGAVGWPSDRDQETRSTNGAAIALAHSLGVDWMMFSPRDDVATVEVDDILGVPPVPVRNGSWTRAPDETWNIRSWPWKDNDDRAGGGAVDVRGLSASDALAAAFGGPSRARHTAVDLGWLAAGPPPYLADPAPEGVWLEPPGAAGMDTWNPWFEWLDAFITVHPWGPYVWVEVADPQILGSEDIEQQMTAGRAIATTGPQIILQHSSGALPGDTLTASSRAPWTDTFTVRLRGGADLDHLALVASGGQILAQITPTSDEEEWVVRVPQAGWVLAAAWDEAGEHLVATGPIWRHP